MSVKLKRCVFDPVQGIIYDTRTYPNVLYISLTLTLKSNETYTLPVPKDLEPYVSISLPIPFPGIVIDKFTVTNQTDKQVEVPLMVAISLISILTKDEFIVKGLSRLETLLQEIDTLVSTLTTIQK